MSTFHWASLDYHEEEAKVEEFVGRVILYQQHHKAYKRGALHCHNCLWIVKKLCKMQKLMLECMKLRRTDDDRIEWDMFIMYTLHEDDSDEEGEVEIVAHEDDKHRFRPKNPLFYRKRTVPDDDVPSDPETQTQKKREFDPDEDKRIDLLIAQRLAEYELEEEKYKKSTEVDMESETDKECSDTDNGDKEGQEDRNRNDCEGNGNDEKDDGDTEDVDMDEVTDRQDNDNDDGKDRDGKDDSDGNDKDIPEIYRI